MRQSQLRQRQSRSQIDAHQPRLPARDRFKLQQLRSARPRPPHPRAARPRSPRPPRLPLRGASLLLANLTRGRGAPGLPLCAWSGSNRRLAIPTSRRCSRSNLPPTRGSRRRRRRRRRRSPPPRPSRTVVSEQPWNRFSAGAYARPCHRARAHQIIQFSCVSASLSFFFLFHPSSTSDSSL